MSSLLTPDDPAYPGQAHYTRSFLRIYDPLVLGFFSRVVWRCPNQRLIDHYSQFIGERHLDIGPGTGYFLEAAPMGSAITLLDPNPDVLAHCAARLSGMRPTLVQADVTRPLPIDGPFDSVALNYVIHCLPSTGDFKSAAVANVAQVLTEDGVLFGATVLGTPSLHSWVSHAAMKANNRRGIFDNLAMTPECSEHCSIDTSCSTRSRSSARSPSSRLTVPPPPDRRPPRDLRLESGETPTPRSLLAPSLEAAPREMVGWNQERRKERIVQLQTTESPETRTERTWLTLARIGAAGFVVWAVVLQLAAGFFDPIIITLALIYAVSSRFLDSEHRGRVIAFTVFAALTMVPNLVFGSSDFSHLESAGSFIPQLFVTVAIALAFAGGVGELRGWSGTAARAALNRAAAVFAVGLSVSLVVSATAPSDRPLPDDVTVDAEGFAWAPGVVVYDASTSSGLWIDNRDLAHHTLAVPDLGIEVQLPSSKSRRVDLGDVEPGEYQIICTIPGHEAMTATLQVTR